MFEGRKPFLTLTACRINGGRTQAELAKALGVSPSTVFNWECGRSQPSFTQVLAIARLSNVPAEFILLPEESQLNRIEEADNANA